MPLISNDKLGKRNINELLPNFDARPFEILVIFKIDTIANCT